MESGTKRCKTTIITVIICVTALCIAFIFPVNAQLVMTPSAHESIEFLSVNNERMKHGRFLRFALYDADCNYIQLCFSVAKQDRALLEGSKIDLRIDNKVIGQYSVIQHSIWKRKYVMFLIEDVTSFSKIDFTYENQTISIA